MSRRSAVESRDAAAEVLLEKALARMESAAGLAHDWHNQQSVRVRPTSPNAPGGAASSDNLRGRLRRCKVRTASLVVAASVVVGASSFVADGQGRQAGAPSKRLTIETIPSGDITAPAPTSLADLAARADAIVKVSFIAYSTVTLSLELSQRTVPVRVTRYEGTASETIKDNIAHPIPYSLSVFRRGGIFDTPRGRVRQVEEGFPDWIMGDDYVLFLKWAGDPVDGHGVLYSADGTFRIHKAGTVDAPGRSTLSRTQRGKSGQALLSELRLAVQGKAR